MSINKSNQSLRNGYKKALEAAFVFSILALIMVFFSFQTHESDYDLPVSILDDMIVIDLPPQSEQLKRRPRPPVPIQPVPADDDKILDALTFDPQNLKIQDMEIAPPPDDEELIVPFELLSRKPILIKKHNPVYPNLARKAGIAGVVVVKVLIDRKGSVEQVEVLKDIPLLTDAAVEAAWNYKFEPGKQRDKFVKVWMSIPFHFRLK